jgi:mRNA interferase RelE/StbE
VERWTVIVGRQPRKIWRRLPMDLQERLKAVIGGLMDDPRPHGYRRLSGHEELYRVRAGDWRVIYHIDDSRRLVIVVAIGPRGQVYQEL